MKLLGVAFKCMKRSDTLIGLNPRYRAVYTARLIPRGRKLDGGSIPACPDVFTRVAITGLSLLKRGLKAFWPARAGEREKVTPRRNHSLKANTNAPGGNVFGFLPAPPPFLAAC